MSNIPTQPIIPQNFTTFNIIIPKPVVQVPIPVTTVPIPKPITPTIIPVTTVPIPKPVTPTIIPVTTIPIPKPVTPAFIPVTTVPIPKPVTPTVTTIPIPKPVTTIPFPKPVNPTVTTIPFPKPTQNTNQNMIPNNILLTGTPMVNQPNQTIIPRPVTVTKPISPKIGQQAQGEFTPEMIDEDTIIGLAGTFDQARLSNLLRFLSDYYHNDESLVSDEIYDQLIDIYEAKFGQYAIVGAEPTGEKVALPYYLSSLRKIKKDNELITWLGDHRGPYIIQDKIDGLTLLLVSTTVQGRRITNLYTRGGGVRGRDVSHLLQYMKFPTINVDIAIRGEIVLTKAAFQRVGAGFKNARNLTSGIVNAKKQFNPLLANELSFYAYRILNKSMTPEQDIDELIAMGFMVPNPVASQTLTKGILEDYFNLRKTQAPYEIDGLVIYENMVGEYPVGEEPRHVVAFKTGTETAITTVTRVEWEASQHKLLKPVVFYETIYLSGADLSKASGYNARFIVNNNIGPGARILLTRSGDVIPKILSVVTPAPGGPSLPDPNIHGNYNWNKNQVEFVLDNDNDEVTANKLKHFINTLDIKNMGPQRIKLIVQAGVKDINGLLSITPQELSAIPGIGPTLSNQYYQDIHSRIVNVPLAKIMDASGIFPHVGERRFEAILAVHPNLLDLAYMNPQEIASYIRGVKGFNMLADEIATRLATFADWLKQHPMIIIEQPRYIQQPQQLQPMLTLQLPRTPVTLQLPQQLQIQPVQTARLTQPVQTVQGNNLSGLTIVFSGFRDNDLERQIKERGGKVTTAVSRNTSFLVMKDINDRKGKANEAEQKGVPLISRDEFIRRYL